MVYNELLKLSLDLESLIRNQKVSIRPNETFGVNKSNASYKVKGSQI